MNDYLFVDAVEGMHLEKGDNIVYVDTDNDIHHITINSMYDQTADFTGTGYCHDHDQDCYFEVGAFEGISLWQFNTD